MPETLLQAVLSLLDQVASPVVQHSMVAHHPPEALRLMVAEGVLKETSRATEIPRPQRYGPGADLVVRETARGIFGVTDGEDFCAPVALNVNDVQQYEVRLSGLVEKLRKENGIDGTGCQSDGGLVYVGERVVAGHGAVAVYLSLPNNNPDAVVARLKRLDAPGRRGTVALLTPRALPQSTEFRRLASEDGIIAVSLMPVAATGVVSLDWERCLGAPESTEEPTAVPTGERKVQRSIGSNAAVQAVHDYMAARGLTETQFGNQFQTTDRTLRNFLKTGKMRRANFEAMAASIGVSVEQLLAGNLPPSVTPLARR